MNKKSFVFWAMGLLVVGILLGVIVLLKIGQADSAARQENQQGEAKTYKNLPVSAAREEEKQGIDTGQSWQYLWVADFEGNRVMAFDQKGNVVWKQYMASSPLPASGYNTHTEYVTLSPTKNIIVSDGEGMMVQEIDRATHKLLWQYGIKDKQGAAEGFLHQPDKAFKLNDSEILVNDGNNRRVIIINQQTNKIVWQYGKTLQMGSKPGWLKGNTSAVPINGGAQIAITDTLEKKIMVVDRATKQIVWEWTKPDAKWLQHAWPTKDGGFVMEDRQKHEVFEVSRTGDILWTLSKLNNGEKLHYPTDVIKLANGNVLIADAGRGRVIEVVPLTGEIIDEIKGVGFATTITIE